MPTKWFSNQSLFLTLPLSDWYSDVSFLCTWKILLSHLREYLTGLTYMHISNFILFLEVASWLGNGKASTSFLKKHTAFHISVNIHFYWWLTHSDWRLNPSSHVIWVIYVWDEHIVLQSGKSCVNLWMSVYQLPEEATSGKSFGFNTGFIDPHWPMSETGCWTRCTTRVIQQGCSYMWSVLQGNQTLT